MRVNRSESIVKKKSSKTVLVTGGAGFIGSHVVKRLLSQGHAVRVMDNFSSGRLKNLKGLKGSLHVEKKDVTNESHVKQMVKEVDAVIHLAAMASVEECRLNPRISYHTNIEGTFNVLHFAESAKVRHFAYASSAAIYGVQKKLPIRESAAQDPLSLYGIQKQISEQLTVHFGNHRKIQTAALRLFNVFGPGQDPKSSYSGVISRFVDAFDRKETPVIFGDGKQTRDFVYVGDVAKAFCQSIRIAKKDPLVCNIGTATEVSLLDLIQALNHIYGRKVKPKHQPTRIGDIYRSCSDITQAKKRLGFKPQTSLLDGLTQLVKS